MLVPPIMSTPTMVVVELLAQAVLIVGGIGIIRALAGPSRALKPSTR